jgi:hypothetical protein
VLGKLSSTFAAVSVAALLLATPTGSAAADGDSPPSPGWLHVFDVKGTNGYQGFVLASGGGANDEAKGGVWIVVGGPHASRSVATVSYTAPATVTEKTVEADLGGLGKIAVELVPTGRTKSVRVGCEGKERKRVPAMRYQGTIDFYGEEGFTEVIANSAARNDSFYERIVCAETKGTHTGRGPQPRGGRLEVDRYRGDEHELEMNVAKSRPGAKTSLSIWTVEERGEIRIQRSVGGWAPPGVFKYDLDLRTATLRPPPPFSGEATFDRGTGRAGQWTGNLTVDLPGRAGAPLTGPGLTFALIRPGPK